MGDYATGGGRPPTLILGYSQMSESRLRDGVREVAALLYGPTARRGNRPVEGWKGRKGSARMSVDY